MLSNEQKLKFALIDLKQIERERMLLNGHFSLVAKRHNVKVKELKQAYSQPV